MLTICPVDIGNIKDVPYRTIEKVQSCDLIVVEHISSFNKMISQLGIKVNSPIVEWRAEMSDSQEIISDIISKLQLGLNVALLSAEGTPMIHDPGYELVREAKSKGIRVEGIPGPTSLILALVVSGFDTWKFSFNGSIENDDQARVEQVKGLVAKDSPSIFFNLGGRRLLVKFIEEIESYVSKDIKISLSIGLTRRTESIINLSASEMALYLNKNAVSDMHVVVVDKSI